GVWSLGRSWTNRDPVVLPRGKYQEVEHYLIQPCPSSGYYYMRPQEAFPSIDGLINHHRETRGHLSCTLSQSPCRTTWPLGRDQQPHWLSDRPLDLAAGLSKGITWRPDRSSVG